MPRQDPPRQSRKSVAVHFSKHHSWKLAIGRVWTTCMCVCDTHTHPFKNTPFCCTFYSKACAFHLDLGTVTGSWWQMCMSLSIWETPRLTCQVLLWHSRSLRFASASKSHTAGSPHTKLSKEAREKGFAPEIAKASVATICSKTTVSQSIQNLKGWNDEALY